MSEKDLIDPALNRMHRCVAILINLSQRPQTDRTKSIYHLCQETMVRTTTTLTNAKGIVKAYLAARTPKELASEKHTNLRKHNYKDKFLTRINDDIVIPLMSHISPDVSLEQHFANLVILEDAEAEAE